MSATHFVPRSSNRKTGPIAATYRPRTTCPSECPLLRAGCYAAGRIDHLAHRLATPGDGWVERAIATTPPHGLLRHLVVGDLLTDTGVLDAGYVAGIRRLADERPDVTQFGYTHAWRRPDVQTALRELAALGVMVNASCEQPADAAAASGAGLLPVLVVTGPDDPTLDRSVDGRRVVVCPAQTRSGVTCASCRLCARPDTPRGRRPVVAFLPHGSGHRAAAAAAASSMPTPESAA